MATIEIKEKITDCGVANLTAAILGVKPDLIKRRLGIPVPLDKTICPECGGIKGSQSRMCQKCYYDKTHIQVVCSYCGNLSPKRYAAHLIWQIAHGHKKRRLFCSKKCHGKWLGENYGRGRDREHGNREKDRDIQEREGHTTALQGLV